MSKYILVLIIGIIIRLFLAAGTYHPDLRTFQFSGEIVGKGNIFNTYDYFDHLPDTLEIKHLIELNYPPAIYWFHGAFNFIFSVVFGPNFNNFLIHTEDYLGNLEFNFHLLFIKLPYLIFDILTAAFLTKLFTDKKQKFLSFSLWIFNPVNLYATYMMGQFDLIPNFFVVLSMYYILKKKFYLASLVLGLGIAFKVYPLYLLVPLSFLGKNIFEKIKIFGLGIISYLITILPFLGSPYFKMHALATSQTTKSLYAQIPVSGGESLMLFPLFLILIYIYLYYKLSSVDYVKLWAYFFSVLFLFFIFTHIHPQWFIWLTPFLIIDFVRNGFKNFIPALILLLSYTISLFFYDPSLTTRIFQPLFPNLHDITSLWGLLNIEIDYNFGRSVLKTCFAGAAVYYIYKLNAEN